jgi:hypothetical protein
MSDMEANDFASRGPDFVRFDEGQVNTLLIKRRGQTSALG